MHALEESPRVLVAEDDPDLLELLEVALTGRGFSVITARNGREAANLLDAARPDVVISDLVMPEADGLDLCNAVRSHPRYSGTPILVLTGVEPDHERLRAALALPRVLFERKPPDLRGLDPLLRGLIAGARQTPESVPRGAVDGTDMASGATDGGRLLAGEDAETTDVYQAAGWLATYLDLLDYTIAKIATVRQRLADGDQAAHDELQRIDIGYLEAEAERFRDRIAFWERRQEELAAAQARTA